MPFVPELAWPALALLIASAAAFVALDLARRLQTTCGRESRAWLGAAAVALGTGLWAAQFIAGVAQAAAPAATQAATQAAAFACPAQPWVVFGTWALAFALSVAVLAQAGGGVIGLRRIAAAAGMLGIGLPAVQLALLAGLGMGVGAGTDLSLLALASLTAAVGGAAALGLFFVLRVRVEPRAGACGAAAACALGATVVLSQHLAALAVLPAGPSNGPGADTLAAALMAALAALTTAALLALLHLGARRFERRRLAQFSAKHDLRKLALRDPLTGLANRVMFDGALNQAVQHADAHGTRLALLVVDLDGFGPINQALGHHNGDRLLREAAARLRAVTGPQDRLARLGADKFLILRTDDPGLDAAAHLAGEVLERLNQPFTLPDRDTPLSASIGIAMYPEHGAMSTLLTHAEAAMRGAKGTGGATYCFFEARMASGTRDQMALLRDLRVALAKGQLELYYQPKIHAPSGEISGVEALMRWHHPQRGMVSPAVFIPIAERYGLIHSLGDWVIDEACRQARVWRDGGLRMRVAINLSVHQLRAGDLAERIGAALERHQIQPKLLTCEITESVAMEDSPTTARFFAALARVGVHISIDDFGTGYSSLSLLRKLPAEELKIDRSFVLDLETSSDARAVAEAVIKLAQVLGLKVVAEGVETEGQNQILRGLGCDELQGYLFAKPMSAKALALWAMHDVGPRSLAFRASLFKDTGLLHAH